MEGIPVSLSRSMTHRGLYSNIFITILRSSDEPLLEPGFVYLNTINKRLQSYLLVYGSELTYTVI